MYSVSFGDSVPICDASHENNRTQVDATETTTSRCKILTFPKKYIPGNLPFFKEFPMLDISKHFSCTAISIL